MRKLIYFIRRTFVAALFIVLEIAAIYYYARSNPYTQAQSLSLAGSVTGATRGAFTSIAEYFSLREQNRALVERIAELENRLDIYSEMMPEQTGEISEIIHAREYIPARVVSNTVNRRCNYMTLGRGMADGVEIGMSVVTPEGHAVGSVIHCSEHYSIAKTMLNAEMFTAARLASDNSTGTVNWDGTDPMTVSMTEVSKYAAIGVGEAVVTTGFSYLFPSDIVIGTVESCSLDKNQTTYTVRVRLAADLTRLYSVLLISNAMGEAAELERSHRSGAYN